MIPEIVWIVLKKAWPFVAILAVWGVMETRIFWLNGQLTSSHKRESEVRLQLTAAQQRATDLALLYAGMLPKVDAAARAQEEKDRVRMDSLNDRVSSLSRALALRISSDAARVLDDVTAVANGRDAAAAAEPAEGAAAVPAVPEVAFSEHDLVEFAEVAGKAYLSCVQMFHETRDLYNEARNSQLKVNQ